MNLWNVAIIVFIVNIPFGYWRANTKKFSFQWFLAIHIPVPVVIALRILSGLGWHFITFPILIGAFFLGQIFGGMLHVWLFRYLKIQVSSCIIIDLIRLKKHRQLK